MPQITLDAAGKRPTLEQLRSMSGILKGGLDQLQQRPHLKFSCLESSLASATPGIPCGAITEVSGRGGMGKTEAVLRFLAEHPETKVAWIERIFTAYPRAFPQIGVDLDRILFIEGGGESYWSALQVLRSGLFPVVVYSAPVEDGRSKKSNKEMNLRRLQLATESSGSVFLLLSPHATEGRNWPIRLQIYAYRRQGLKLKVLKAPGMKRQQGSEL